MLGELLGAGCLASSSAARASVGIIERRGNQMRKVLPLEGRLSTWISAPCAMQIDFTIDRPSPAPPSSRERDASTR
jgi:hypothetical protein